MYAELLQLNIIDKLLLNTSIVTFRYACTGKAYQKNYIIIEISYSADCI